MYQCMNGLLPDHFCNMFAKNADFDSYETRNQDCVHVEDMVLSLGPHFVYNVKLLSDLVVCPVHHRNNWHLYEYSGAIF